MALLFLVRHGETRWNRELRWQGHSDEPLTDLGRAQADAVAGALAGESFVALWSSDLLRAVQTAAPLAGALGLPLQQDPAFREVDVGSWAGLTREEAQARDPEGAARHAAGGTGWSDGETYAAMGERAERAANELAALYGPEERIALVTHGGVIRALAAAAVGISSRASRLQMHPPAYVSLTVVHVPPPEEQEARWRLIRYNQPLATAGGYDIVDIA